MTSQRESQHWRARVNVGLGRRGGGHGAPMQVPCAGNPEKKALLQQASEKKRLPTGAHVLFSAPILIARLHSHRA